MNTASKTQYMKKWRKANAENYRNYQREYRRKYRAAKKAKDENSSEL